MTWEQEMKIQAKILGQELAEEIVKERVPKIAEELGQKIGQKIGEEIAEKKVIETAKKLLSKNIPAETVAECTGLSLEEVLNIFNR